MNHLFESQFLFLQHISKIKISIYRPDKYALDPFVLHLKKYNSFYPKEKAI